MRVEMTGITHSQIQENVELGNINFTNELQEMISLHFITTNTSEIGAGKRADVRLAPTQVK